MECLKAKCDLWILTCSSPSEEEEKFELEDERQSCSVERDDSLLDLKLIVVDNFQAFSVSISPPIPEVSRLTQTFQVLLESR